jgi:hypothetical protein
VLVDTEGNLLKAKVHPADLHDTPGGVLLLTGLHILFPTQGHAVLPRRPEPTLPSVSARSVR